MKKELTKDGQSLDGCDSILNEVAHLIDDARRSVVELWAWIFGSQSLAHEGFLPGLAGGART